MWRLRKQVAEATRNAEPTSRQWKRHPTALGDVAIEEAEQYFLIPDCEINVITR